MDKKRYRRKFAYILPILLLVQPGLIIIFGEFFDWQVNNEISRIRREGDPTTIAEITGKPIPDSENAAVVYAQAAKKINWTQIVHDKNRLADFSMIDPEKDAPSIAEAQTILARYTQVLEMARQAVNKPGCRFSIKWSDYADIDFDRYFRTQKLLALLLDARAEVRAAVGDTDGAVDDLETQLGIADSIAKTPTYFPFLVRLSLVNRTCHTFKQICSKVKLSADDLSRFDKKLAAINIGKDFVASLKTQRVLDKQILESVVSDREDSDSGSILKRLTSAPGRVYEIGFMNPVISNYLYEMRNSINHAQLRATGWQPYPPRPKRPFYVVFDLDLSPNRDHSAWDFTDRAKTIINGTRLLIRLQQWKSLHGKYPDSLAQAGDSALIVDPLNGKPFHYKRLGSGFKLYSTGPRQRDRTDEFSSVNMSNLVWQMP